MLLRSGERGLRLRIARGRCGILHGVRRQLAVARRGIGNRVLLALFLIGISLIDQAEHLIRVLILLLILPEGDPADVIRVVRGLILDDDVKTAVELFPAVGIPDLIPDKRGDVLRVLYPSRVVDTQGADNPGLQRRAPVVIDHVLAVLEMALPGVDKALLRQKGAEVIIEISVLRYADRVHTGLQHGIGITQVDNVLRAALIGSEGDAVQLREALRSPLRIPREGLSGNSVAGLRVIVVISLIRRDGDHEVSVRHLLIRRLLQDPSAVICKQERKRAETVYREQERCERRENDPVKIPEPDREKAQDHAAQDQDTGQGENPVDRFNGKPVFHALFCQIAKTCVIGKNPGGKDRQDDKDIFELMQIITSHRAILSRAGGNVSPEMSRAAAGRRPRGLS